MGEKRHRFTYKYGLHTRHTEHNSPPPPIVTLSTPSQINASPGEKEDFKELNTVDKQDEAVPKATIVDPEPGQNKLMSTKHEKSSSKGSPSSASSSGSSEGNESDAFDYLSQIELLSEELEDNQKDLRLRDKKEDEEEEDKQLMKATEYNRTVPSPEPPSISRNNNEMKRLSSSSTSSAGSSSVAAQASSRSHRHLVFTEPQIEEQPDRITVTQYYGQSSPELKPHHEPRVYLVANDFSKESRSAIEWTMGTILRDHDEIYVVTIVSQEQDLAELDMPPAKVLGGISKTLNAKAKMLLSHMLLFDIKLVTIAKRGRVREVLETMMDEIPSLTMVVCGCRGRSTMKGMLMGSVSTFLLHKAPVPVTVIRYHKKKKHKSKRKTTAHATSLSESMKTGHLVVDELGAAR